MSEPFKVKLLLCQCRLKAVFRFSRNLNGEASHNNVYVMSCYVKGISRIETAKKLVNFLYKLKLHKNAIKIRTRDESLHFLAI